MDVYICFIAGVRETGGSFLALKSGSINKLSTEFNDQSSVGLLTTQSGISRSFVTSFRQQAAGWQWP